MPAPARRIVGLVLLGALLVPSHGIWARGLRHARRHARQSQQRQLRQAGAANPVDRRGQPRPFQAPAVPARSVDPGRAPVVGDEPQFSPTLATVDPSDDDDHRLKKGRRKGPLDVTVALPQEPPKIRPAADHEATLLLHLSIGRPHLHETDDPLVHFGSGPCHSIPRPREGTICPLLPKDRILI